MAYKYCIVVLLFGLNLWPALVAAEPYRVHLQFHHNRKLSQSSDNPLITKACEGLGSFQEECFQTLNSAPAHQKADVNGLAFFILRFVEDNAANLTTQFQSLGESPDLPPLLEDALKDGVNQYIPLDDLIEDAVNAVLANAYPDAEKYIHAAMSSIERCDQEFEQDHLQEQQEEKSADEFEMASGLRKINTLLGQHLSAALNIVKAHA